MPPGELQGGCTMEYSKEIIVAELKNNIFEMLHLADKPTIEKLLSETSKSISSAHKAGIFSKTESEGWNFEIEKAAKYSLGLHEI